MVWLMTYAAHKTLPVPKSSKAHRQDTITTMCQKQGSMESVEWRGQAGLLRMVAENVVTETE